MASCNKYALMINFSKRVRQGDKTKQVTTDLNKIDIVCLQM